VLAAATVSALSAKKSNPRGMLWGVLAVVVLLGAYLLAGAASWTFRALAGLDGSPYVTTDPVRGARVAGGLVLILVAVLGALAWRAVEVRLAGAARVIPLEPRLAGEGRGQLARLVAKSRKKLTLLARRYRAKPALAPAVPGASAGEPGSADETVFDRLHPVVIGANRFTGEPVEIPGPVRFVHTLVVGPTGSGKTSRVLAPMVFQDLERLAAGEKLGVTVVEPKGDFVAAVAAYCDRLGLPYVYIDPPSRTTHKFNPLEGEPHIVAECIKMVLSTMFGDQEAYFRQVQETAAQHVVLLLKSLKGDDLTLLDVVRALRDPDILNAYVTELERRGGDYDLIQYFKHELLGRLKDKYYQFASGLRQQLEDLTGNELLRRVLIGRSDVNLNRHLSQGGVLLVNTAMGPLAKLGDIFGQLFILFFQQAVFQRPGPTEWHRMPHYFYVDELPVYLNKNMHRLLTLGRSNRCAAVLAVQELAQIAAVSPSLQEVVLTNCQHKIIFGGVSAATALEFQKELGEVETVHRSATFDNELLHPPLAGKSWREDIKREPRLPYTRIIELAEGEFIYYRAREGKVWSPPVIGVADWHPAWKKLTGPGARTKDRPEEKLTPIFFVPGPPREEPEAAGPRPVPGPVPEAAPEPVVAEPPAAADDFWKF
jgi:hypothetical protein